MATVKFDEGTKKETSLNLEDGEGVIFVKPPKNLIARAIGVKTWNVTVVLTNRRLVVIPQPPNKKNMQVESYYYKDIESAGKYDMGGEYGTENNAMAFFSIYMKSNTGNSKFENKKGDNGYFMLRMEMNAMNFIKVFIEGLIEADAKNPNRNAGFKALDYQTYTAASVDRYYAAMDNAAKQRAANMDFSNTGHVQMRDYIIDVVNAFVEEINK